MPTYVYACDSCGAQFEQFQSFKDEPIRICPSCAGAVRRVFQPVGIVFKGSGWYITDSRKSSSAAVGTGTDDSNNTKSEKTSSESTSTSDTSSSTGSTSSTSSGSASTGSTSTSTSSAGGAAAE